MSGNRFNITARKFAVETKASGNLGKAQEEAGWSCYLWKKELELDLQNSSQLWAPPQLATGSLISEKIKHLLIG